MRRAIYEDDVIKLLDKGWKTGVYPVASNIHALPSAQSEHALKDCRNCKHGQYNDHLDNYFCYNSDNCEDWNLWESDIIPSAQPEPHEIGYPECANAMLKMWIDNVLTDGEYSRIMDKLNAHWAERREE